MYFSSCSRCSITLWMKRSLTILGVWRTGRENWKKRRRGSEEKERRIWRSQQVTSPRKRRRKTDALIASCKIKKLDICTKEGTTMLHCIATSVKLIFDRHALTWQNSFENVASLPRWKYITLDNLTIWEDLDKLVEGG